MSKTILNSDAVSFNASVLTGGPVASSAATYIDCSAGSTTTLQVSAGAIGDRLSTVQINVTGVLTGTVQVKDGTGAARDLITTSAAIGMSIQNLDWVSSLGGWSVITPPNCTVRASGKFS